MRANAEPVRIARIGLVLEMADGSKVMVYADDLSHAEAVISTETPFEDVPWSLRGRRPYGPPETSITLTGIEAYRILFADRQSNVNVPSRTLETFRREVRP